MNELARIEDRIRTMETRQRRLRAWCVGSTALWIVSCLAAVARPWSDELRTKRLVLVDDQGAECGTLGMVEDGAALTLKSRDARAWLMLAASTAELEQKSGFTISSDGKIGPQVLKRRAPWSGLIARTGDEENPERVTTVSAGEIGRISMSSASACTELKEGELQLDHGSVSGHFRAEENGCGLYLGYEDDEDLVSELNLLAAKQGCWFSGSRNEDRFIVRTDADGPRISLSQPTDDQADDAPAELELRAADHAGSIELRKDGKTAFRVPE